MFGRFYGSRYYGPRYFGDGVDVAAVVAETPSGGWFRKPQGPFRGETGPEREARIHAERVRMGIIVPEADSPADGSASELHELSTVAKLVLRGSESDAQALELRHLARLAADRAALAEYEAALELAGRYTSAYLDHHIALYFRLQDEQARLQWLRDEDDAAVLILAIATIH